MASVLLIASSCNKESGSGRIPVSNPAAKTLDAICISCISAKLPGQAILQENIPLDNRFGILYSTSSEVKYGSATEVQALEYDSGYKFYIQVQNLEPATKYWYRAFIYQNGDVIYGELKSFVTKSESDLIFATQASNITEKSATLSADCDFTDYPLSPLTIFHCGFCVGDSADKLNISVDSHDLNICGFSSAVTLSKGGTYFYQAFIKIDSHEYRGPIKTFTTVAPQIKVTTFDATEIRQIGADLHGKLELASISTLSKTAFFYYSSTAKTAEQLIQHGSKTDEAVIESDGSFCVRLVGMATGTKYYFVAACNVFDRMNVTGDVKSFTTISLFTPEAVDLGLSVKWASFNLGASKPEETGRYFYWGDTIGQTWDGTSWSNGGFSNYGYVQPEVDSNNALLPKNDAAHVLLGEHWRIPTPAECKDLLNSCTKSWTDNYKGTSIAGMVFKSKVPGYTDNSIFIPACGRGDLNTLQGTDIGSIWANTVYDYNHKWYLMIYEPLTDTGWAASYYGFQIRPVYETPSEQ